MCTYSGVFVLFIYGGNVVVELDPRFPCRPLRFILCHPDRTRGDLPIDLHPCDVNPRLRLRVRVFILSPLRNQLVHTSS